MLFKFASWLCRWAGHYGIDADFVAQVIEIFLKMMTTSTLNSIVIGHLSWKLLREVYGGNKLLITFSHDNHQLEDKLSLAIAINLVVFFYHILGLFQSNGLILNFFLFTVLASHCQRQQLTWSDPVLIPQPLMLFLLCALCRTTAK
jgi:hypothetical protein